MISLKHIFACMLATLMLAIAGCGGSDYTRGSFSGFSVDKTQEEVLSKFGKPDSIDESKPDSPRWIYKKKTFDTENQNKTDDEAVLVFVKDPSNGKLKVKEIVFG